MLQEKILNANSDDFFFIAWKIHEVSFWTLRLNVANGKKPFHLNVLRFSKAVLVSSEAAVKNILSFFVVYLL